MTLLLDDDTVQSVFDWNLAIAALREAYAAADDETRYPAPGAGFEAREHVRALAAVRELRSVQVFSPRAESRDRFARELADLATEIVPAEAPDAAVAGTSLVICAARSYDETPILLGRWL